ncbi:AAA family ATPase [Bradyrhizobium sp. CSS354]|uniref:AAA family ATPase n=1 Tax=Bradyrhizobium sp. CSS354 TaxID=2699172 RepID=UPI0023AFC2EC|nr:AAA family ATPase [Bradyrhizobium sp. CSS354]MDE5465947.1 AAA family ATPase [Bradyrhizobium sp. CSS354]
MKKTGKKKSPRITFRMVRKKLSDLHGQDAAEDADADFDIEKEDEPQPRPARRRVSAVTAVVGAAFEAAVPSDLRRRLRHNQALAAVIVVPTLAWVVPVAAHARSVLGSRWCVHTREGADRRRNAAVGSDDVARDLSRGMCVMGVAADAALLPTALSAGADVTIRIAAPDAAVLKRAIGRFARRSPGELPDGLAAGLDLHDIVAAFRPGTGARDIVRRLQAAADAGRGTAARVPVLETAVEYGPARRWGLDLALDVAAYRAQEGAGKEASGNPISWRDIDRGICLHSPPGMGKSIFPSMLAAACGGIPLVSTSVGGWFGGSGYLDAVLGSMRSAFQRAAALASPCAILHLDEVDALPNRETMSDRSREWWNVLVSEALLLLDSALAGRARVVVIGSTNMIDRVDPALLRPGRLEKIIEIPRPDAAGALNILRFHLESDLREDDLSELGVLLEGSTGAEVMYAVRAARRTARNAGRPLSVDDLRRAVLPVQEIPAGRLFRMSVHEAAHAIAALAIPVGTVRHVVLRTSGESGGRTVVDYGDDPLSTRRGIEDRVVVGLAARAAERIFCGAISTSSGGARSSDIGASTAMIASVHGSFGMGEDLVYLGAGDDLLRDIAFNADLRGRVARHMRELEGRAERLVEANRAAVLAVARRLADRRFLSGDEVAAIARGLLAPDRGAARATHAGPAGRPGRRTVGHGRAKR